MSITSIAKNIDRWSCDDRDCDAIHDVVTGSRVPAEWFIVDVWAGEGWRRTVLSYCPRHGSLVRADFRRIARL